MENRIKEFDSVRGIAVFLVFIYHIFKRAAYFTQNETLFFITDLTSIGWIGVDMFFTLSGFLITSILLRTKDHEHYFKNFYMRRILRIIPLYFAMIALVLAFIPDLEPEFLADLHRSLPVFFLFQQNWLAIFTDIQVTQYLWVTWSLAVEEQFYFIWPFILYRFNNGQLLKGGIVYIILSVLSRILGVLFVEEIGHNSIHFFFYYSSFTRFEEILIGSLLALLFFDERLRAQIRSYSIPTFVFFLALFLIVSISSPDLPHPGFGYAPITIFSYTLVALFTAGLLAAFVSYPETALIRRLFQGKIFVFLGKYSYALYLFHMPVAILLLEWMWRTKERGWYMFVAYVAACSVLTVVCALLSWNILEKHMLSLKKYFEYS